MSALGAWTAFFGFFFATASAAMVLVFVFDLTGAEWWRPFERTLVRLARALALAPLGFVPLAVWSDVPSLARSAVCLLVFVVLALALPQVRKLPALGLIVLAFTLTVGAMDWLMTREPDWVSDLYGLYVFASGFSAAMAIVAVTAASAPVEARHALGRLFFCSVMVWAYLAFFQLLLVWLPDLPREVAFYDRRSSGPWAAVSGVLAITHFALPFLVLLFRGAKRSPRILPAMGGVVLGASVLDFAWLVAS